MQKPVSLNFGPRRHGGTPDLVVLHYTAMETCEAACARLCDPNAEVSAHYVISETGAVVALVAEKERAWHAGAGAWGRVRDVNSHSIGIELANSGPLKGFPPFPEPQMNALSHLLGTIQRRWSIPVERVIAHSDMAPGRKADPGPKFDWARLALEGLSIWPAEITTPENADMQDFIQAAKIFGYVPPDNSEAGWTKVLAAFRLRFCPSVRGALEARDVGILRYLATHYPCSDIDDSPAIA